MINKIKKTFTLDSEQSEKLRLLAKSTKIPQSVLVREALDNLFTVREKDFERDNENAHIK
jgi:predicted transcriptional regulator